MKPGVAVDTNVPVEANDLSGDNPDCALACVEKLREIRSRYRVLLDSGNLILDEYRKNLSPRGQPGLGDAFFKWLWDNQENKQVCRKVLITPHQTRGFVEFPDDPALARFDRSDRKFVAAVIASGEKAAIVNAVDTDWWDYGDALKRHGVTVLFLCPELMEGSRRPKKNRG